MHDAKTPPDDERPPEQTFDLLWRGVGGHVKVFGRQAQQQVAHRTTHDVGLEPALLEGAHDVQRTPVHQRGVDAVLLRAHVLAFAKAAGFGRLWSAGLAQQLLDEGFDHENRFSMGQPRAWAMAVSRSSGLVATGWLTFSSRGRSLMESL